MTRSAALLERVDAYTLWAFNPPRVRRGGTRPSTAPTPPAPPADVVVTIAALLAAERELIAAHEDPVRTLRDGARLRRRVTACLDELEADGPPAVRALRRRGWSFARIAEETGLSTRRVAELARASHRRAG